MTSGSREATQALLDLERADGLLRRGGRRLLVLGLGLLVAWQATFAWAGERLGGEHRITAAQGLFIEDARHLAYFLYYTGLYPVVTTRPAADRRPDAAAARALLADGPALRTEVGYSVRLGDHGRYPLLLVDAWLRGRADADLRYAPANGLGFALGLAALLVAFARAGRPALGAALVVALGSSPFQLHETWARDNVFAWVLTALVWLLAINAPLLLGVARGAAWAAAPVLSGLVVASARQVRPESKALLAAAAFACLAAPLPPRRRVAAAGLLLAAFLAGSGAWEALFSHQVRRATAFVHAAGGRAFPPEAVGKYHPVWHPVFAGLADFGGDRGYEWSDVYAYRWAADALRARGVRFPYTQGHFLDLAYPPDFTYALTPVESADYVAALREKVLGDIAGDPSWYAGVLARRAGRLLVDPCPAGLSVGRWSLPLPASGLLLVAVAGVVAWTRQAALARLLAFPAALAAPAMFIHSGGGLTHYFASNLVAVGVALAAIAEALLSWRGVPAPAAERLAAAP